MFVIVAGVNGILFNWYKDKNKKIEVKEQEENVEEASESEAE